MNPQIAAKKVLVDIRWPEGSWPQQSPTGLGPNHALYLLEQVAVGGVVGEKAHRWLGWAQCLVVVDGRATLERMKEINHQAE